MATNGTTRKASQAKPITLEVGWGVAIILREPVNGGVCYVGEIQAMDDRGLRVRLMDWLIGAAVDMDWWFPWSDIAAMEVADHECSRWDPGRTQIRANHAAGLVTDEKLEAYYADRRAELRG